MGYSNVLRQLGFNNNTVLDGAGACKASQRGHHKQASTQSHTLSAAVRHKWQGSPAERLSVTGSQHPWFARLLAILCIGRICGLQASVTAALWGATTV